MEKILCLIPAKGSSSRLKKKNLLEVGGKSLLQRAVERASSSNLFEAVVVSTEDCEVAEKARALGASITGLRPENLSKDPATITDVLIYELRQLLDSGRAYETVCVTLPTSPFVKVSSIHAAYEQFCKFSGETVISVSEATKPPFNAFVQFDEEIVPAFPESQYKFTKSTECPKTFFSNGGILFTSAVALLEKGTYRSEKMHPIIMEEIESMDIDTDFDLFVARALAGDV